MDNNLCPISKKLRIVFLKKNTPFFKEFHFISIYRNKMKKLFSKVRNDCIRCRIMFKKTLELEISNHDKARTVLSPPFHSIQMDIVFGFRAQTYML